LCKNGYQVGEVKEKVIILVEEGKNQNLTVNEIIQRLVVEVGGDTKT
jgi:hypothetical protein